jgi:hypothetical protein
MKIIFILIIITQTCFASTLQEVEDAKKSIQTLIQPLLTSGPKMTHTAPKDFQLQGCEKHKINWMNVLLMRETAKLDYHFAPGCDVEGTIVPKVLQEFPVSLNLRNLQSFNKILTQNKITASFETKPVMLLEMTSGVLSGPKGEVKFEADYRVQLDPANKTKVMEKNLGGELRISEIYGKKVTLREKIFVK